MNFIEIESERLIFRKYEKRDFSVFYDMLSDLENMKYRSSEPKNDADVSQYLQWGMSCAEQKPCINYRYAVALKHTGEIIGEKVMGLK